jgi:hypothetical protein
MPINCSNCHFLDNPLPQYLNTITIATNQAIANSRAMPIFIMDGVDVENKCIATRPLTINLPYGKKVLSTHVCDIQIPGLPTVLMVHIILSLSIASLIGICLLCQQAARLCLTTTNVT